jgi:hypothetical protein
VRLFIHMDKEPLKGEVQCMLQKLRHVAAELNCLNDVGAAVEQTTDMHQ